MRPPGYIYGNRHTAIELLVRRDLISPTRLNGLTTQLIPDAQEWLERKREYEHICCYTHLDETVTLIFYSEPTAVEFQLLYGNRET